jgi:hypothetical protein
MLTERDIPEEDEVARMDATFENEINESMYVYLYNSLLLSITH